jgi:hypothetical protein
VEALRAHQFFMQAAMKTKQSVDVAVADTLDAALELMSKMYTK